MEDREIKLIEDLGLEYLAGSLPSWFYRANVPVGMALAGEMVDGLFERGFEIYGIPIGTDKYITCKLMQRAEQISKDAKQTVTVLNTDRQALWSALRLSISNRFDYFCQLSPPSLVEPVAEWLDVALWNVLEAATGFTIPRENNMKVRCPVNGLDDKSYQITS